MTQRVDDAGTGLVGVHVNFTSDDANDRVQTAYSAEQWQRLVTLKATYDPTNFFRFNANIPPDP